MVLYHELFISSAIAVLCVMPTLFFSALSSRPDFLVSLSYCLKIPFTLSLSAPHKANTSSAYPPAFICTSSLYLRVVKLNILISLSDMIFLFEGSMLMLNNPLLNASPCLKPLWMPILTLKWPFISIFAKAFSYNVLKNITNFGPKPYLNKVFTM